MIPEQINYFETSMAPVYVHSLVMITDMYVVQLAVKQDNKVV